MNPEQFYAALERFMMQYLSISLIVSFPFIILISQCALAVREIAMNTREEFTGRTDYKSLELVAEGLFYLSWCCLFGGIVLLIKSWG